ncbi:fimbrillin family protein [uncultured Bacteroides sp.]|uniref:fimbrillin family protein n=1 Tax=uncultured Bacteroides sp. TaxID=162156 RepID=UPI0026206FE2|nr:fimbrillin family protein [uncultured Bacteroides sp.]
MKMRLYIKRFGRALAACAVLFAAACDDRLPEASDAGVATEPMPVHIEVSRVALRAVSDAATRTAPSVREWKDGDAIQITAVFNGEKITDKNSRQQYCCYKYNSTLDEWEPDVPVNKLMWPVGVESAEFTAYYVEGIKGAFSGGTEVRDTVFLLGNIEEGTDPLYCTFHADYGESVYLNFRHLCTHLTLADVKTEMSDIYWLYGNAGAEASASEIPNAYKLEYDATANKLKFSFVESLRSTTMGAVTDLGDGHYVISRKRVVEGEGKDSKSWVDFYLAPSTKSEGETRESDATYTYGKNCKLNYVNNHPYLSFTSDELDTLKAGIHYELSVERSTGIVPEPQTDFPDKPGTDLGYVHIPDLLAGIVSNSDVTDESGNLVLKSTGEAYPRLLRDVDFHNFNPIDYILGTGDFAEDAPSSVVPAGKGYRGAHPDWKLPRMEGNILDGDYHSFLNVAYPIFYSVENGEIYNLAIRDSKLDIKVKDIQRMDSVRIQGETATEGVINTDFGILAAIFRGKVSGLLLDKVDMTVHLDSCLMSSTTVSTYSIGCVAGRQAVSTGGRTTIIENVELRGDVKLTVQRDGDGILNSRQDICVGIIAGQSGATIDGVTCAESRLTETPVPGKCTLSLPIYSHGNVKAGGLVGKEVMTMQDASINAVVDASQLNAAQCYIGGLVGEIVNESESNGKLLDCTANVAVTGGISHGIDNVTYSYSYCGGIAGKASTVEIKRITIWGTVKGGTETVEQPTNANMMIFATGGGFGYVSGGSLTDCRVGAGVTAASVKTQGINGNHTGRFVGMTPDDYTDNTNGNQASGTGQFVGNKGTEPTPGGG